MASRRKEKVSQDPDTPYATPKFRYANGVAELAVRRSPSVPPVRRPLL